MNKYLTILPIANLFVAAAYALVAFGFTQDGKISIAVFLIIFQINVSIDYAVYKIQNKKP